MRRDADGYYYFVGRRDDMINVAGENVYPKEVEDILLQHPNLRDACVVPAPHDVKGEVPIAFVVERERGQTTEDDVRRFFLERGAPYAHPRTRRVPRRAAARRHRQDRPHGAQGARAEIAQ